jgi:hypothetical protein
MIEQIPDWRTKTAAVIAAELADITETETDPTPYTYAGLALVLGFGPAVQLRVTLQNVLASGQLDTNSQALLDFAHARLEIGGLDFSLVDVQSALEGLRAVSALAPFIDGLKAIGVRVVRPFEGVTIADVSAERAAVLLAERRRELIETAAARWNAFCAAVDNWDGSGVSPVL